MYFKPFKIKQQYGWSIVDSVLIHLQKFYLQLMFYGCWNKLLLTYYYIRQRIFEDICVCVENWQQQKLLFKTTHSNLK